MDLINGVSITKLKQIKNPLGDIFHVLKKNELIEFNFGEAYFSFIEYNAIKPWKKHSKMTLNLVVPIGKIKFVCFDDRKESRTYLEYNEYIIGPDVNYSRLTIEPGIWMAFQGVGQSTNMLLNIADIEHDPEESIRCDINNFKYEW